MARNGQAGNALGIAQAKLTYRAYRELLDSSRWGRLANEGARPQRLLWASTGTKDPEASDVLYVRALAARLQSEGADAFVTSWDELLGTIGERSAALAGSR